MLIFLNADMFEEVTLVHIVLKFSFHNVSYFFQYCEEYKIVSRLTTTSLRIPGAISLGRLFTTRWHTDITSLRPERKFKSKSTTEHVYFFQTQVGCKLLTFLQL